MTKKLKHELILEIDTTIDDLWSVLTDSKYTKEYMFNCSVKSNWEVGSSIIWEGNYQGYDAYQKGEILEIIPNEVIKYSTFDPNFGLKDEPNNYVHVCYLLEDMNGKVKLSITNETFDGDEERIADVAKAWALVSDKLKDVAEQSINITS